jgi:hypothetical protein
MPVSGSNTPRRRNVVIGINQGTLIHLNSERQPLSKVTSLEEEEKKGKRGLETLPWKKSQFGGKPPLSPIKHEIFHQVVRVSSPG